MMRFHVISIFPKAFDSYLGESLFRRAREKKILAVKTYDLRDFSNDRHRKVDDRPFGGGPGMVLKVQPIEDALAAVERGIGRRRGRKLRKRTILFSARGGKFDAAAARRLARYDDIVMVCGR